MEATQTVRVDSGRTVEMTGPVDALDKITAQMQSHDDLLAACRKFVATWGPENGRNQRAKLDVARRMAMKAIEKATPLADQTGQRATRDKLWGDYSKR